MSIDFRAFDETDHYNRTEQSEDNNSVVVVEGAYVPKKFTVQYKKVGNKWVADYSSIAKKA